MIIEDFVMLGRTVPEPSKTHGTSVCSAGYSREMRQFVRVYPLRVEDRIPRWSVVNLPVVRNKPDSRIESWKLKDCGHYSITGSVTKDEEFDFLKSLKSESIDQLNVDRRSLGIISHLPLLVIHFQS